MGCVYLSAQLRRKSRQGQRSALESRQRTRTTVKHRHLVQLHVQQRHIQEEKQKNHNVLTNQNLLLQAGATSIDAFAVGISFAILNVNIVLASAVIGITACIVCYIGGILGKHLGKFLEKKASIAGGMVLVAVGIKILLEHIT